jgi:predicted nucleic acid-binding protein
MNDKVFLDTNVLIYAHSADELIKRRTVESLINNVHYIIISTQVVNEFIHVMNKKRKISFDKLSPIIDEFFMNFSVVPITQQTIKQALKIAQEYHYSYFDSLMLSSAVEYNCSIIYTEDMHDKQLIEDVLQLKNPF